MHEAIIFANGYGDDAHGKAAAAHDALWYELTQGPLDSGHMRDNRVPFAFSEESLGLSGSYVRERIAVRCRKAGYDAPERAPVVPPATRAPRKREFVQILEV